MASQRPPSPAAALDADHTDARRPLRRSSRAASHHPAGSHLRWLWPWRHAEQQDCSHAPDMIGQPSGHRGRTRWPLRGRARPRGQRRLREGLAHGGMRQAAMVGDVGQRPRLVSAVLACAERRHTPPDRGDMLADTAVEACHEGGRALPAAGRSDLRHRCACPADHPMAHPHQAPSAYRLDPLRSEQTRQGYPAWRGGWPGGLVAQRLHPGALVRQPRHGLLLAAIGKASRHPARCQDLGYLMDDALRHGEGPLPDVDRPPPLRHRVDRLPHPTG
jgi:hypothetical protein